jgi:penicillin-binding protein 1C
LSTWYIPGKSPIRISNLHRIAYLDAAGRSVCGPGAGVHEEVYEFWTSDMLRLFREAGMPRRVAPPVADCGAKFNGGNDSDGPRIVSPVRGLAYTVRISQSAPLLLRAVDDRGLADNRELIVDFLP